MALAILVAPSLGFALGTEPDWRQVGRESMRAVVRVEAAEHGGSDGSGFVISPDGYIMTNAHVVGTAKSVPIWFENGGRFDGEVVHRDGIVDLALIKIPAGSRLPFLSFSDAETPARGQAIAALGSPLGYNYSLTRGVISGLDRTYRDHDPVGYLQHDAPINGGNSGGPLVDEDGRVVGINTAIADESSFSIGIGLAIPAKVARAFWGRFETGRLEHGALGVRVRRIDWALSESLGLTRGRSVLVERVDPGSAAYGAGLRVGDLITGLDGHNVNEPRRLGELLWSKNPGDLTVITALRDGIEQRFSVRLGEAAVEADRFSMPRFRKLTSGVGTFGFVSGLRAHGSSGFGLELLEVSPDGAAARAGLTIGDRILSVNGDMTIAQTRLSALIADEHVAVLTLLIAKPSGEQQFVTLQRSRSGREVVAFGAAF